MTSLFPTFGSIWQRAKRLLGSDISPIWQRLCDAIERDSERYQEDLERLGLEDLSFFSNTF